MAMVSEHHFPYGQQNKRRGMRNRRARAKRPLRRLPKSLLLVLLMLGMSLSPLLSLSAADAGRDSESEGTLFDTGWMTLDLTGADGQGELASADFHHLVPYGVQMTDVSLEIRVDGANGLWVDEPRIWSPDSGSMVLDWSGGPSLGKVLDFTGGDPHIGRMVPRSDSTATWQLPANSTVTDIVMEALRPVDPLVSLSPYFLEIQASAIHPDDGRLYLAISGGSLLMLDSTASPAIIDRIENAELNALVLDESNGRLLGLDDDGNLRCWSLDDGASCAAPTPPSLNDREVLTNLILASDGTLWGAGPGSLYSLADGASSWNKAVSHEDDEMWPDEDVQDLILLADEVLVATSGEGVGRWDFVQDVRMGSLSTANHLPSDEVSDLLVAGGQLFVGTTDEGLARQDLATGNWLATWHGGNWLSSDTIVSLASHGDDIVILTEEGLHVYNTIQGSFTGESTMEGMGLNDAGTDLVVWPAGGSRAPTSSAILVSDGSGLLAVLDADAAPQAIGNLLLATTPTNEFVDEVIEVGGYLFAAGDRGIDRYEIRARRWLTPILPEAGAWNIATDGTRIYSVGDESEIDVWALNGSHIDTIGIGMSAEPTDLAWDALTGSILMTLGEDGLARVVVGTGSVDVWNENDDFQSGWAFQVAARDGVAYVAIEGEGVARVDLVSEDVLGSWRSSGVDEVEHAPIAVYGEHVYLGLSGAGVFVFNRTTGELEETWGSTEEWWLWGDEGELFSNFVSLPNSWVMSLHTDVNGDVYVGHEGGFVRRTDSGFESPSGQDGLFFGGATTAFASDSTHLYALQSWQGLCRYRLTDLEPQGCWSNRPNSAVQIDVSDGTSLRIPSFGRLYATTEHGAYLIDTVNQTLLQEWTSGGTTWNTPVVVWNSIAHLGIDGVGVARYDLSGQQWLSTFNEASGSLPNNGVTAMTDDVTATHLWVAGDFGLAEVDMQNGNQISHWDTENTGSEPVVSHFAAQQLVRIDDVLYYLETPPERRDATIIDFDGFDGNTGDGDTAGRQRPPPGQGQGGAPSSRVHRYDVVVEERLSNLNAAGRFNNQLSIIGMEAIGDILWIGVGKPFSVWFNNDPGGFARWDAANDDWLSNIEPDSEGIDDGMTELIGDCDPLSVQSNPSDCRVFLSFSDDMHLLLELDGTLVTEWDYSDIAGLIRMGVMWDEMALLATPEGVARIDTDSWDIEEPWTAGEGLPPSASDNVRALEVIDGELWMATRGSTGTSVAQIHRLDGVSGQWMTWSGSSTDEIPGGIPRSIEFCADIIHIAFTGEFWNGEGGIARWSVDDDDWLEPLEFSERDGWGSFNSLACDEHEVLYAGVDQSGYGIQRYSYEDDEWLEPLSWEHDVSDSMTANDALAWEGGVLVAGHPQSPNWQHYSEGGLSMIPINGDSIGHGQVLDWGTSSTGIAAWPQVPGMGADWLVAQPGASGPGRAKLFSSSGEDLSTIYAITGLNDGRSRHFAGNSTHVYAAMLDGASDRTDGASVVLEGVLTPIGEWVWQRAWDISYSSIERLLLEGDTLYVTTRYDGLYSIDLASGQVQGLPPAAHDSLSLMVKSGNAIIIGMSAAETAAGVSVFDLNQQYFVDSALLPGLPSPIVNDVIEMDGSLWFATPGGVGSWDFAAGDWGPTISSVDGLSNSHINSLEIANGELWVATAGGLCAVEVSGPTVRHCMTRSHGLVGSSTLDLEVQGGMLYASHDGFGPSRPGATMVRGVDRNSLVQYHADSLPSNDVTAIAADSWGVHIATTEQPLSHWNASNNQMEHGVIAADLGAWPVTSLSSDGTYLYAGTYGLLHRISVASLGHTVINTTATPGIQSAFSGSLGLWIAAGDYGVWPFGAASGFEILPQVIDRRANPLRVTLVGEMFDITSEAKPGNVITLALPAEGVAIPADSEAPSALILTQTPLIFSSDVDGAAVWASIHQVDYSGTWDLATTDAGLRAILEAVAFGSANESGHDLHLRFDSPQNGSIEVRLSYIGIASDSPVQLLMLEDRPNDGGDALVATWTPTLESGFSAYHVYMVQGDGSGFPPDSATLSSMTPDLVIPSRFNVQAVLTTAEGLPLQAGVDTYAVVAVAYSNGNLSNSTLPLGPVQPFDDIPLAPAWANAELNEGNVEVEWEWCTALDHYFSHWDYFTSSPEPLTSFEQGQGIGQGGALLDNQAIFAAPGVPIWIMIYCVDNAWQIDLENPLIIGPIVTAPGTDSEAPEPVEWVKAEDFPNDAGGAIQVEWAASEADDCALYAIYLSPVSAAWPPASADEGGAEPTMWITGCERTQVVLTGLTDGQPYWVTVVPFDAHLNANLADSPWDQATPMNDLRDAEPPVRVSVVNAFDVPNDIGNSIDVQWSPVPDDDLAFYTIWVSEHDVSDVSGMWSRCGFYLDYCAEMVPLMQLDSSASSLTLQMNRALYGDELSNSVRNTIQPDVPLYVTVTAHDEYGNVHLDGLVTAMVTPVDDLRDDEAPPRLVAPSLSDVSSDGGGALWLEFSMSTAPDVAWYEVFVEPLEFSDACNLQPAYLLPIDSEMPTLLERYGDGRFLEGGEAVTVAVVPVDSSSNFFCDGLATATMAPIDDSPPGVAASPISNLKAEWNSDGSALEVSWTRTDHALGGLSIFISGERFAITGEAVQVAVGVRENTIVIEFVGDEPIDNSKTWWIGVVNDHERGQIVQVDPIQVSPFGVDSSSGPSMSTGTLVILSLVALLVLLAGLGAFVLMRRGGGDSFGMLTDEQSGYVSDDLSDMDSLFDEQDAESSSMESEPEFTTPPVEEEVTSTLPSMEAATAPAVDLPDISDLTDDEDEMDTSFLDDLL